MHTVQFNYAPSYTLKLKRRSKGQRIDLVSIHTWCPVKSQKLYILLLCLISWLFVWQPVQCTYATWTISVLKCSSHPFIIYSRFTYYFLNISNTVESVNVTPLNILIYLLSSNCPSRLTSILNAWVNATFG